MASRIAESHKWRTQRGGDDGGSYQLLRLHLQRTNEHAAGMIRRRDAATRATRDFLANSRARESLTESKCGSTRIGFLRGFRGKSLPLFFFNYISVGTRCGFFDSTYNLDFNFCNCIVEYVDFDFYGISLKFRGLYKKNTSNSCDVY